MPRVVPVPELRKVGFLLEMPTSERVEFLNSHRRNVPHSDEERMIHYLESGSLCGVVPGVEEDPLGDTPTMIGAPNIYTDGFWAWPETIIYYLREYHLLLPEDFVKHMRDRDFQCPSNLDVSGMTLEGEVAL